MQKVLISGHFVPLASRGVVQHSHEPEQEERAECFTNYKVYKHTHQVFEKLARINLKFSDLLSRHNCRCRSHKVRWKKGKLCVLNSLKVSECNPEKPQDLIIQRKKKIFFDSIEGTRWEYKVERKQK